MISIEICFSCFTQSHSIKMINIMFSKWTVNIDLVTLIMTAHRVKVKANLTRQKPHLHVCHFISDLVISGCVFFTACHAVTINGPSFLSQSGQFSEDMIPTVGFNMRKVTKGNVTIKVGYICQLLSGYFSFGINFTLDKGHPRALCPALCSNDGAMICYINETNVRRAFLLLICVIVFFFHSCIYLFDSAVSRHRYGT